MRGTADERRAWAASRTICRYGLTRPACPEWTWLGVSRADAGIELMRKRHAFQQSVLTDLRTAQNEASQLDKELDGVRGVLSRSFRE